MIDYLLVILAYLLGSVPFGLLISKLVQNVDIREHGSGNIGATNVLRKMGPAYGILVLLLDLAKGVVVMLLARYLEVDTVFMLLAGFLVVLGHCFPIFLKFDGGKGVATTLGVLLFVPQFNIPLLVLLLIFVALVALTRYVSLGSVVTSALIPVAFLVFSYTGTYDYTLSHVLFGIGIAAVVIFRHRENISRLLSGTESKIGKKD